jgi:uncharacterized repeat protein (TIGR03803 family)
MFRFLSPCIVLLAACGAVSAQTYSILHTFGSKAGDPSNPEYRGTIAQARGGTLVTTAGDELNDGVGKAFRISTSGSLHVLHEFSGPSGGRPTGGLILARDGKFYGTTATGGTLGLGTIFKMSADGTLTTLHEFQGGSEGENPTAAPIQSLKDDLYGTTQGQTGSTAYGSIYTITKDGNFTVLHTFNGSDGAYPQGPLVQGTDYNFYGVTWQGGTNNYGTFYRISPSGVFKVLVNFNKTNGQLPDTEPVLANDGNFYGVTWGGGTSNAGVLYRVMPNGHLTVLYSFTRGTEGGNPIGLTQASDGNLYGTAMSGGNQQQDGAIFRATTAGVVVGLYQFTPATGAYPYGALRQHTNGILYGDTFSGGDLGQGVIYSLNLGLSPFVTYLPVYGRAGAEVQILGQGFTDTSQVFFNGTPAVFKEVYPTFIKATVPDSATTGPITVINSNGTLTSNRIFIVHPN